MSETTSPRAGLTRRSFLKTTGAVAGAAALTGAAVPTLTALAATTDTAPAAEEQVFYSNCGGNCGGPFCRMKGIVREGKLVQVRPADVDPDHPTFKTGCVKGQTGPQRLYGPKRNLYPLKRAGERGAGEWERISWDEAIATIAEKMKNAQTQYGDSSIAFWHSYVGGGSVLNYATSSCLPGGVRMGTSVSLERFVQKTGATVMAPAADKTLQWAIASIPGLAKFAPQSDLPKAKTILIWGANPTGASRTHQHFLRKAKESGSKIVTIDPLVRLNAIQSDVYLPVRPATDGFLALAMCNWVIDNDLVDWEFLRNDSVAPILRKEDGTYLRLSDLGMELEEGPVDPETGEPTTVDAEVVYDEKNAAFGSINKVESPAVLGSYEANGFKVRTVLDYVIEHIKEYTVEKAAEVCDVPAWKIEEVARLYATEKPAAIDMYEGLDHRHNSRHNYKDLMLLACLTGNYDKPGSFVLCNHLAEGEESGDPVGGTTDTSKLIQVEGAKKSLHMTGMYLHEVMEKGKLGSTELPLRVVYCFQGNPLASDCGPDELKAAIDKLDLFVVADPHLSDTARYADIVLPIAMTWEKEDAAGGYAMYEKAVEPAGECKTDMDVFRMLADKMGFPDLYDKTDEEYLREALDTPFNKANGFTYDDYKEKGFIVKFTDQMEAADSSAAAATPKVRNAFYIENPMSVDMNEPDIDREIESRPYWEKSLEVVENGDKYPLHAFSIHEIYHAQSILMEIPWIDELRPEPRIEIHEEAAAARGIKQGDTIKAYNDRGFVVCKAVVTKGIRPDCILLPHGWQTDDFIAGHLTDLTRIDMDGLSGNGCYNEILCEVELYDGGAE